MSVPVNPKINAQLQNHEEVSEASDDEGTYNGRTVSHLCCPCITLGALCAAVAACFAVAVSKCACDPR